jgi:RNA polymerase sigma factor (sigma-70 family)
MAMGYEGTDLLADFREGSEGAYSEVYARYYDKLFRSCMAMVQQTQEAQDVAIESLTKLFTHRPAFSTITDLENWLFASARRGCIDVLRRRAAREQRHEAVGGKDEINDELDWELMERTFQYVDRLPPQTRRVIILRYLEGKRYKEIGAVLNISPRTAENLVDAALRRLRKNLLGRKMMALAPLVTGPAWVILARWCSFVC